MSDDTLGSLFETIASNRREREVLARQIDGLPSAERPMANWKLAAFDQECRDFIDLIDGVPELLAAVPLLRDGWPYPADAAIEFVREEVGPLTGLTGVGIDTIPVRKAASYLGRKDSARNGSSTSGSGGTNSHLTRDDLSSLPRWARVAFAARCARRIQRLATEVTSSAPSYETEAVERAIRLAEQSASEATILPGLGEAAKSATPHENLAKLVGRSIVVFRSARPDGPI